ncbi:hypothetical protein TNCV_3114002 [Trichonephila clavipes]|nr:hypothetical protein TNCV_3114002 [Trichonephila clavipes]
MGLFEGCYAQCSDSTHLAELKTHIAQHILNLTPETLRSVVEQAASKFKLVAENGRQHIQHVLLQSHKIQKPI